jgi:hypothetical protein
MTHAQENEIMTLSSISTVTRYEKGLVWQDVSLLLSRLVHLYLTHAAMASREV